MKKKRFYSAYAAAAALLMGTILTGCSYGETIEGAESAAVDLGLSVKWAAGNVGAENPEDYFPAAGYFTYSTVCSVGSVGGYWTASWDSYYYAWILGFDSGIQNLLSGVRYCGYSVRGVCE